MPPTVIPVTRQGVPGRSRRERFVRPCRRSRGHAEVGGHRVDPAKDFGTVADQVGVAEGLGDLAVLDEVRLSRAKDEVAGGGVDLPSSELGHVDALRRLGHDLVGIGVPGQQKGVGHPDHRQVLVALATTVARRAACPPGGTGGSPTSSR